MLPKEIPAALEDKSQARFGVVLECTALTLGQSGAQVFKFVLERGSLIIKSTLNNSEPTFYAHYASTLRAAGVSIPALEWSGTQGDIYWLALEYVPEPLPRERWLADPLVLSALRNLHRLEVPAEHDPSLFQPRWTTEMDRAASDLSHTNSEVLFTRLEALRAANTDLFQPICFISGDPNPTNWGVRSDGTPVLFDWERFGLGTPALDLAITIPGLASKTDCLLVAAAYLSASTIAFESSIEALSKKIAVAKVWNVVEYISFAALDHAELVPERVKSLAESLAGWMDGLIW